MRFLKLISKSDNNERAIAFIELALVIPLYLILIVGVVDLGRALITYLNLVQVAYEGVRLAGTVYKLEGNNVAAPGGGQVTPADWKDLFDPASPDALIAPNQLEVQRRIHTLMRDYYRFPLLDGQGGRLFNITSEFVAPVVPPADPRPIEQQFERNIVTITIDYQYESFFSAINIPMKVKVTGPYTLGRLGTTGTSPCDIEPWIPLAFCP